MMGDMHAARTLAGGEGPYARPGAGRHSQSPATPARGSPQSIETSTLHLDIARDLKRIAAHIASVAYPILEQGGALRRSRLLDDGESVPGDAQVEETSAKH